MINEKPEMGFTEYLNAHYLKRIGSQEVQEFYRGQASALEKALGIEDNNLIQGLIGSFETRPELREPWAIEYNSEDSSFISYLFSQRMRILEYINWDSGIIAFPAHHVEKEQLNDFFKHHRSSKETLLEEIEWCDRYIWEKLTRKPWVTFSLDELRKEHGYPNKEEADVIAENW